MQSTSFSNLPFPTTASFFERLGSAVFYAACSGLITIVNKIVLTSYAFPSFQLLAVGQLAITIIVLYVTRFFGIVHFPQFSKNTANTIMPLPLFFLGNLLFGLGSTQAISLPMFTVLRRFSIWMTMIAEQIILHETQSVMIQSSVYVMLLGSLIAASDDLTYNWFGYMFLLFNNLSTAAQNITIKRKMITKELNQNGLLFYNSVFVFIPVVALTLFTEDLQKIYNYDRYRDVGFICAFLFSAIMGFLLNYSAMLCTNYNSPLTTAVVGACKNMFVTYLGIFIGGDYVYSLINFIGLNISVLGSIIYSWATFAPKLQSTTSNTDLSTASSTK